MSVAASQSMTEGTSPESLTRGSLLAESLTLEALTLDLRATNSRLRDCLDRLDSGPMPSHAPEPIAGPQEMAALLSELMRAGQRLRLLPAEKDAALELELAEYRRHVERLRDLLPAIHDALQQQRTRLERERSRVHAAMEWARRSRQTL